MIEKLSEYVVFSSDYLYPQVLKRVKMMIRSPINIFLVSLFVVFFTCTSFSWSLDGRTLAQKVYDRDDGKDSYAKINMLLVDKRGKERSRKLVTAVKDYGNLNKSYIRFTSPAEIDGTSFLTWENEDRDDDQFLYLPALRRVRRIVSNQKKNRFVNTDYTYEDMERRKVDEDIHRIYGDETYNNYDCWVLESIPKDQHNSQYGKRLSWVVKDIFIPIKTEYYDKKGRLTKRFLANNLKKINEIWTVLESEMNDLERKHRTMMKISEIRYNSGVADRVFTKNYMLHSN